MKRVLLPMLSALALPAFAGGLGNADCEILKNRHGQFSEKGDHTINF